MREISHFIAGRAAAGTSGRFGEVFDPNLGEVQARVALAFQALEQAQIDGSWAAAWPLLHMPTPAFADHAQAPQQRSMGDEMMVHGRLVCPARADAAVGLLKDVAAASNAKANKHKDGK